MKTTEPIRDKDQIDALVGYYLNLGQIRNYVLIVMALHTALRVSDLLLLRWEDVYDFANKRVHSRLILTEQKTGKRKSIALHQDIIAALELYSDSAEPGAFLFENPRTKKAINRSQAYRIIRSVAEALGFSFRVSCHSLRKTFGFHALNDSREPEKTIMLIMKIYNHSSLEITYRYLGFTQDDIDAVYLGTGLSA